MTLDIADYKTESWTISKGIQDAMWVMSATIDKHTVPAFFQLIKAVVTDHISNPHTLFIGIIPAADFTLTTAADKASLKGYDCSWYLTVQYVPADERTTEEDTNPSTTITNLLGGLAAWSTTTGIEPYRINTVTDWTNIKKSFEFGDRCTRWKAIQEICDYCNFVFVVKWRDVGGNWRPCAYFVHEDDIDSDTAGLDIPAPVIITDPDPYLLSGVSIHDSPQHRYNRVMATGYDVSTDTYFYATAETTGVTTHADISIEYVYADVALNTQEKTDLKAQELLDFFQESAKTYHARFTRRMDLELYQKISFVGYNKIETDEMRITKIVYSRSGETANIEIEFSKDQAIRQLRRIARAINPDYVAGSRDLMNSDLSDIGLIDVFDEPLTGEGGGLPPIPSMWEVSGSYAQLATARPIDLQGQQITKIEQIKGELGYDLSFSGSDEYGINWIEFAKWNVNSLEGLLSRFIEIKEAIFINNDSTHPKIYFDMDSFRPTLLQAYKGTTSKTLALIAGGNSILKLVNYADPTMVDFLGVYAKLICTQDLVMDGCITRDDNNNLEFKVHGAGKFKFTVE